MQQRVNLPNGGFSHEHAESIAKETADSTKEKEVEEQKDGILFQLPLPLPQMRIRV
jgi:hypothetical protein